IRTFLCLQKRPDFRAFFMWGVFTLNLKSIRYSPR
ncbi:L-serine ammonia-lyase, partial [Vibrio cholerae HC-68A1]